MAKMTAAEAAIWVLESEGVDLVFRQPGAAILPLFVVTTTKSHNRVKSYHSQRGPFCPSMNST
jgi:tartronate-semialdehyde synthase